LYTNMLQTLHWYCFSGRSWLIDPFSQTISEPHKGQFIVIKHVLRQLARINISLNVLERSILEYKSKFQILENNHQNKIIHYIR
jgi:hypothetical protein